MAKAHVLKQPDPPSRLAQQAIPEALDLAILRAIAKQPEQRWQSAAEFSAQLGTVAQSLAAGGAPAATSYQQPAVGGYPAAPTAPLQHAGPAMNPAAAMAQGPAQGPAQGGHPPAPGSHPQAAHAPSAPQAMLAPTGPLPAGDAAGYAQAGSATGADYPPGAQASPPAARQPQISQLETGLAGPKRYPWPLAMMVTVVCGLVGVVIALALKQL
jgi:hypothetical protein